MAQFRVAAMLMLLGVAGCYSEAPQQSTVPDPQYVSGPPGGGMAPGGAYGPAGSLGTSSVTVAPQPPAVGPAAAGEADDADDEENDGVAAGALDPQAAPGDPATDAAPPVVAGPDGPNGVNGAMAPPDPAGMPDPNDPSALPPPAAGDPMASVSDAEINAALAGYGQWMQTEDYGPVWSPDATGVGVDFTPYESGGAWAYTDAGWAFASDYPWGWLPFHYGRWGWLNDRWCWAPGHRWGPAWVQWRHGGGIVGWRPTPPKMRDPGRIGTRGGDPIVRDHRHAELHDAHWRFARVSDFARPHVRAHLFGNTAEGLRVTAAVTAPPLRARTAIPAASVMRDRFAVTGRQPGRIGAGVQLRDHRVPQGAPQGFPQGVRPGAAQAVRPAPGGTTGSFGAYRPPVQTYRPPVQTYRPPVQTYRPPVQTYRPPVQAYRPPVYGGQPSPGTFRPVQPPAGTFQPGAPPPSRAWSPPAHSWSPPVSAPTHTYTPAPAPSAPHPSAPASAPHPTAAPIRVR